MTNNEATPDNDWITLTLEPPLPKPDENTLEPNRMLAEVLAVFDETQDMKLLSGVAVQLTKYGNREQGLALFDQVLESETNKQYGNRKTAIDLARAGELDQALAIARSSVDSGQGTNSVNIFLETAFQVHEQGNSLLADSLIAEALEAADDNPEYVLGHSVSVDGLQSALVDIAWGYAQIDNLEAALEVTRHLRGVGDIYGYVSEDTRGWVYSKIIPRIKDLQQVRALYEIEKSNSKLGRGFGFSSMADIAIRLFQLGDETLPFEILELLDSFSTGDEGTVGYRSWDAENRILSEISIHLTQSGRRQEAIEIANRIKDYRDAPHSWPSESEFYHYKGLALIELGANSNLEGNSAEALELFEEAFNLVSSPTSKTQEEIALAFTKAGQIQTALRYIEEIDNQSQTVLTKHYSYLKLIPVLISLQQFDEIAGLLSRSDALNIASDRARRAEFLMETMALLPDESKTKLDISDWLQKQ